MKIAKYATAAVATSAPSDVDVGECSDCRNGLMHVCPLDQRQSEAVAEASQDLSQQPSSQMEQEYLRLIQENETFLEEHPASQRSQEEKSQIKKIRNRMNKISRRVDIGPLLKRFSNTNRMTQSQGKDRSDSEKLNEEPSQRNEGNQNQEKGYEGKR